MSAKNKTRSSWGACPNCSVDLSAGVKIGPPYLKCPVCGVPILPIWWQRILWVTLGFFLAFMLPASLGLGGWDIFFVGLLLLFPATVFAYILAFTTMPPKYVRQKETFTTLFRGLSLTCESNTIALVA